MKTSVKNLMMSFALMGCLIIGASDASAQGRSRSQGGSTNRSQSAAVSRSSNSSAPTVSRSNSASTRRSSAAPQVNRSNTSDRSSISRSTGSTSSSSRPSTVTRPSTSSRSAGATTRRSTQSTDRNLTVRDSKSVTSKPLDNANLDKRSPGSTFDNRTRVANGRADRNRGNGNMDRGRDGNKDRNGNMGNGRDGNRDRNGNMGNGRDGNKDHNGNRPGKDRNDNRPGKDHNGNHGHNGSNHHDNGHRGYSPNHHYDYSNHHYRDQFSWNHSHHNWSRPLPPPARVHRPAPVVWHRPVIPVGWRPYASAPVIDRILGLMFGTFYEASLDHLYYNGYFIDGYADGIIYLRDVSMMDLYWPDVMLNYEYNKLVNAQFVYHSSYYDRARFDRVYRSLCRVYGPPVFQDGMTISWYGGNNTGWVTLTLNGSYGDYYTTMSIGY